MRFPAPRARSRPSSFAIRSVALAFAASVLGYDPAPIPTAAAADYRPPRKELGFPVYTNAPAGRQLAGQHAPASTPALSPSEARAKFTLPEGFEIRLFASEPEVVNPVAMTWDDRGRLWVVELYEYPLGSQPGAKPRDRIKILEDVDADGVADKVHVWADGLNLATGILLGNGGAYVGQAPHLLFLRDTDGDDRADDVKILKTGFGLEDRHELLNGFTWGPDGQFYMTHGVFTRSSVIDPAPGADGQPADPVLLTAGVARWNTRSGKFEVYAEGTSNPWGVDFDRLGNAYVSACVIEHLFHLSPAGLYDRQAGSPPHPYAYQLLPAINDHKHHMAAYAGIQVYQGDQFTTDHLGTILQGNIHDNAVHQDVLKPRGSSFTASHRQDLVRANDGWFMPVSTQVGPDGAVWIMDWYDRYPCYQNANADPAGVDREHGRIWRVVHTGTQPGKPVPSRPSRDMNLARLGTPELVELLRHRNVWQRRTAQRVLSERRDPAARDALVRLFENDGPPDTRLAAYWTLFSSGMLDEETLLRAVGDRDEGLRLWAARFIGERQVGGDKELAALVMLASDPSPSVRLAVAVGCRQFTSGQMTVDRPPARAGVNVAPVLAALVGSSAEATDPVLPFMIWHASEPLVAAAPDKALDWLADWGPSRLPLSGQLAGKTMRRICDLGGASGMEAAVAFVEKVLPTSVPLAEAALDGLIKGQEGKALVPRTAPGPFIARLRAHPERGISERGQRLGTLWGDAAALQAVMARLTDGAAPLDERIKASRTVRQARSEASRPVWMRLLGRDVVEAIQLEAISALGELGGDDVSGALLSRWNELSPAARRTAATTLSSRRRWALPLLDEVRSGKISSSDFGAQAIRGLVDHRDDAIRKEARAAIGRFRESGADKAKAVAARREMVLQGEPDLAAGHEVAKRVCLVCHKLLGEGESVGPDLTGVGRSSLESLLWNVIDPNQVIGAGYEQVEIETRDDRVVAGRLMENTDLRVRLLLQGGKEEVIARSNVKSQRTLEASVMPEGLDQMPDADLRNLIWYILAPPQEGPLTKEKKNRLSGTGGAGHASAAPGSGRGVEFANRRADRESAALWNPEWRLDVPEFEGTPSKLPEFLGQSNVLVTHPYDRERPAGLERVVDVPAGEPRLRFSVAAHELGDWQLRVRVDGREVHRQTVGHDGARWRAVEVDLREFSGRRVTLRLENAANDWAWEFGYWAGIRLESNKPSSAAR